MLRILKYIDRIAIVRNGPQLWREARWACAFQFSDASYYADFGHTAFGFAMYYIDSFLAQLQWRHPLHIGTCAPP